MIQRSRLLLLGASFLAASSFAGGVPSLAFGADYSLTFADVADRVRNSVVTVATAAIDKHAVAMNRKRGRRKKAWRKREEPSERGMRDDFSPARPKQLPGEPPLQFTSIGSGFIIDSSGLIVTNNHVVEGGHSIYIILADGTELKADKVIGSDSKSDITLLKVTPKPSVQLQAVTFGDSSRIRVGDWVIAVGNPFGLNGSVTAGILSGRGRDISAGPYDFLQTDAAINRGNSGGPLFNKAGEVIGINTAIFSPSGGSIGLGFAIPSNTARRIVDQLERYGKTRWGWIGARLQTPSDDWAAGQNLPDAGGALVARVDKGGPAETAGLIEGDLILSFANQPVKHARQLPRIIAQIPVGEVVDAIIVRGSERKAVKITIGELKSSKHHLSRAPAKSRRRKVGKISFEPLSDEMRAQFPDAEGAVVSGFSGAAADAALQPGDIVVEAAHQKVRSVEELEARLGELRRLGRTRALLTVEKPGGAITFAAMPLGDG